MVGKILKSKSKKAGKFLILSLIFAWIFSGWPQIFGGLKMPIEVFGQEIATSTSEATTSTSTVATSTNETATSSPETAMLTATSTISETASTTAEITTEEVSLPEKPVKKQSLLANVFGALFDLLFEGDLPQVAISEDRVWGEKVSGDTSITAMARNGKAELWTSDLEKENWQKIADEETISKDSPLGFENNIILWLSPDQKALVGLDTLSQAYFSQTIEPVGDTVIELNSEKYIVLIQNKEILITPQINEINEGEF